MLEKKNKIDEKGENCLIKCNPFVCPLHVDIADGDFHPIIEF